MKRDLLLKSMNIFFIRNGFELQEKTIEFLIDHSVELANLKVICSENYISFEETFCDKSPKCVFTAYEYLEYMYDYACNPYLEEAEAGAILEEKLFHCIQDIEKCTKIR